MELRKKYQQDTNESKAVPCPDPRCGLSFDLVDALQYHCQDTQSLDLIKFNPRGSTTSGALVKEDCEPKSLLKGLDDKTQTSFVNETVETKSSLCNKRFIPKDESNEKRKRGMPRKHCSVSSVTPPSTVSTIEPGGRRKRKFTRAKRRCRPAESRAVQEEDTESDSEVESSNEESQTELARAEESAPSEIEDEDYWEVEAILDDRDQSLGREYYVRWKGCSRVEDSWEPSSNFNQTEIIDEYERNKAAQHGSLSRKRGRPGKN